MSKINHLAFLVASVALGSVASAAVPTPPEELAIQAPAARVILDGWQAKSPKRGERVLHLVYWTPADREPAPRYRERLTKIFDLIRAFYAHELERNGFGPRTIRLAQEKDGLCKVHLVRGAKPYSAYQNNSGADIRTECVPVLQKAGVEADSETLVIFCNMSNWDEAKKTISQNSPYYANGTSRSGTAWQVDSPILDRDLLDKREPLIEDGQYGRISMGRYNSIFIGGITHELGHAIGLPHCCARPDQASLWGTALMGNGNRTFGEQLRGEGKGTFLTFTEAARLASHPMFSGSVKDLDVPPNAQLDEIKLEPMGKAFRFSARVKADPPAYLAVAYTDPAGGRDYDATTHTTVPDKDGRFSLLCDALEPGKSGVLKIIVAQANGAVSSATTDGTEALYPYLVAADGAVDLSSTQAPLLLAPLIAAVNVRNAPDAGKELRKLGSAPAPVLEAAKTLVATLDAKPGPAPSSAKGASCALSDAASKLAEVGYDQPTVNRLPGKSPLLLVDGRLYARGVYAHAPAKHVWELDGKWSRLTGTAAMVGGNRGTVVFSVTADGKEMWHSEVLRVGETAAFDVAVKEAKLLELRVSDNGDGKNGDTAVWLEPTLLR